MIETEHLVLRPVRLEDDAAMVRLLAGDEAGVRMTERLPWPMTREAARGWLALRLGPGEHAFAICPKAVVGMVGVVGFRLEGEVAGFGYWLGAGFRGRGFATEALLAGLGHARALGARCAVAETFLDNPAQWRLLASQPELGKKAVEEVMRVNPTVTWVTREALEDFTFEGLDIAAGTTVHLFSQSAGTDPRAFPDSAFDIEAERKPHFGFGGGAHHCLGHFVARGDMSEDEFAPGGVISEAGLARLRELMPEARDRIMPGLRPRAILGLFSVQTFATIVRAKRPAGAQA